MVQKLQIKRTATPNLPPEGLEPGELVVEMATNPIRLWAGVPAGVDGLLRKLVNFGAYIAQVPPTAPTPGDFWYESDSGILWMWYQDDNSSQWVQVNGLSTGGISDGGGSGGGEGGLDQATADTLYVNIAGDQMTGTLTVGPNGSLFGWADGAPAAGAVAASDANILLYGGGAGSENWAGIGSDPAGSMWFRVGNSGTPAPVLWLNPQDQSVNLTKDPTGALHAATKQYVDTKTAAVSGAFLPLTGGTITGHLNITGSFSAAGTIAATNAVYGASFNAANIPWFTMHAPNGNPTFQFEGSRSIGYPPAEGHIHVANNGRIVSSFFWDGSFQCNGIVGKPGGGMWGNNSDSRIKTVNGDYTSGLTEILALRPVRYTYKGNDTLGFAPDYVPSEEEIATRNAETAPYRTSPNFTAAGDATEYVGLVAQEAETVMPEMVTQHEAYIDGVAVTDLRRLDATPLIYALVNAVKELSNEVNALKTQLASRK